jgi:predicted Zn finger-like uncharacterized protein
LIVECEHCHTKYRIADDKVKGKGVKVRCAKCESVFTVMPPESNIQTTAPQAPDMAPTLPEPEASGPGPSSDAMADHTSTVPDSPPQDKPGLDPAEAPPGLPLPTSLDASPDPSIPVSEQQVPDTAQSYQEPPDQEPPFSDEFQLESGSSRPAHELDQAGLVSPPADTASHDENGGFKIESTVREDPISGSDSFGSEDHTGLPPLAEGIGQDEEWGNIPINGQSSPESADNGFGLAGEPGYVPPPPVPIEEPMDQVLHDHMNGPSPETSTVPTYKPEVQPSGGGKKILVSLVLLGILGAGGYYAYPTVMAKIQARNQQAMGTITPDEIRVKVLTRTDGKILYSVRGVVKNESAGNVGMVQVEAQFRNAAGDVVTKAASYCGNLFSESELVNLDLQKVHSDLQNELGQSLSNANISPGQAVPFLVVLDNPPAGINKVTVTISSFKETT